MGDAVNHPEHYNLPGLEIEAIDVIRSVLGPGGFESYCRGNAIKYLIRAGRKDNNTMVQDLKKAQKYTGWAIEEREEAMSMIMGIGGIAAAPGERTDGGGEKCGQMYQKICQICGKEFEANQPKAKYCSDECREEAHRREVREGKSKGTREPVTKVCPNCGKEFETTNLNRKYCSETCAIDANRKRSKKTVKRERAEKKEERKGYVRTKAEEERLARKSAAGYGKQQMAETLAMAGHVQLPEGA